MHGEFYAHRLPCIEICVSRLPLLRHPCSMHEHWGGGGGREEMTPESSETPRTGPVAST